MKQNEDNVDDDVVDGNTFYFLFGSSACRWRRRILEHRSTAAAAAGQSVGARQRVRFRISVQWRNLPISVARAVRQAALRSLRLRRSVGSSFATDPTVQRRPVRGDGLSVATPGECDWSTSFDRPASYSSFISRLFLLCVSEPICSLGRLGAFVTYFKRNRVIRENQCN